MDKSKKISVNFLFFFKEKHIIFSSTRMCPRRYTIFHKINSINFRSPFTVLTTSFMRERLLYTLERYKNSRI